MKMSMSTSFINSNTSDDAIQQSSAELTVDEHNENADVFNSGDDEIQTLSDQFVVVVEKAETPVRVCQFRQSKQKCRRIFKVIDSIRGSVTPLSIEERNDILSTVLANQNESVEQKISESLMPYLKTLYMEKKYTTLYDTLHNIFPEYDADISLYIAKFIGIPQWRLSSKFQRNFQR